MQPEKITKQILTFQKTAFDNSFTAMVMIQEQTEKIARTMVDQAAWIPEEGKKAIDEWVKAVKKGQEEFKKAVDESFHKVEEFFEKAEAAPKAKSK